jgi:uncharacterized iron-regulated membrane protein
MMRLPKPKRTIAQKLRAWWHEAVIDFRANVGEWLVILGFLCIIGIVFVGLAIKKREEIAAGWTP